VSKPKQIPRTRHLFPEVGAWLINGQRGLLRLRWLLREDQDWFPAWSIGAIAGVSGVMLAALLFFFEDPQLAASPAVSVEANDQRVLPEFPQETSVETTPQPIIEPILPSTSFPSISQSLPDFSRSNLRRTELPFFWDQEEVASYQSRPKRVQEEFVRDNWSRLTPKFAAVDQFRPYMVQGASIPVTPSYVTTSGQRTPFDGIEESRTQGVLIEKHALPTTSIGDPYTYVIHVINPTNDAIDEVYVHEKISAIHRVQQVEPPAAVQGDELVWSLGKFPAKARKAFRVTLSPDTGRKIETETRLKNVTKVGGIARVSEPLPQEPELLPVQPEAVNMPISEEPEPEPLRISEKPKPLPELKLAVTPVSAVRKGETLSLNFNVSNVGNAAADNVTLYVHLSGEFKHKYGERVKHTITRLEPGQIRSALFQARAKEVGTARLSASLRLAGDEKRAENMNIRIEAEARAISNSPRLNPVVECQRPELEKIPVEEVIVDQLASTTQWTKFSE
jgi:hypothetical protein